jgi:BirA family biotin operon repressor/biotin-[acetyl-CoA-carboxylase] ligase
MHINSLTKSVQFKLTNLDVVSSTNTIAREFVQQGQAYEGLTILANEQNAGRGQHGTVWEGEYGKNVLCSVVFVPSFLNISQQTWLNMAFCLALRDALSAYCSRVLIKWPNDIYIDNKKVAGILIENSLQGTQIKNCILGFGINVNQQHFNETKATALIHHTQERLLVSEVLTSVLHHLQIRYNQLQLQQFKRIKTDYLANLFGLNQELAFESGGKCFHATIMGVDDDGRLVVNKNDQTEKYMVKQISML